MSKPGFDYIFYGTECDVAEVEQLMDHLWDANPGAKSSRNPAVLNVYGHRTALNKEFGIPRPLIITPQVSIVELTSQ